MKKIIQNIIIIIATLMISCDPDDGNTNTTTDSIVGKWQLSSIVFGVGTTEEPLDECDSLQIYHFKDDNNLELYFNPSDFCGSTTYTLSYTFEDNELTTEYSIGGGATYIERNTVQLLNATTLKYVEVWNNSDGDLLPESQSTYTYNRVD